MASKRSSGRRATRTGASRTAKKSGNASRAKKAAAETGTSKRAASRQPSRPAPTVPPKAKQLFVRTSERSSFKRCRHAWQWGFLEEWKPRVEKPALRFGTLIHAALEARYPVGIKRGPHPARVFEKLYDEDLKKAIDEWGFFDADGEWANAKELGVTMLEGYVDLYGKDEEWKVIASEMTFQVPVFAPCPANAGAPDPAHGFDHPLDCKRCKGAGQVYAFTYVGTIDGVWENRMDGGVRIQDYKTCKDDAQKEAQTKDLDEQATAYWTWGADFLIQNKVLPPRHLKALDGMLYTFLRKAMPDDRPQNARGEYLNKPTKAALIERYGEEWPSGTTVDDMIHAIGPEALQLGEISKTQPPKNFHRELVYRSEAERERARARVLNEVRDMIMLREAHARGDVGRLYKAPHFINCRMCGFRDMCELHEIGQDWEAVRDATMRTWDPYAAHEIEEAEKR